MKVLYSFLADFVIILHFTFIIFAVLGGFLVLWRRWMAWLHLPAVAWAVLVVTAGWICPLTPLENFLLERAGEMTYQSGFIDHYIMPVLYPAALTRELQIMLGLAVLVINIVVYSWVWRRRCL